MDEEKDLNSNTQDVVDSSDTSDDSNIPLDEQDSLDGGSGGSSNKVGNGYGTIADSNRQAFKNAIADPNRLENQRERLRQARERQADPYKMKKGHENEDRKTDSESGESNFEEKGRFDKAKDRMNTLGAHAGVAAEKINKFKAISHAFEDTGDAVKILAKEAAKAVTKKALIAIGGFIAAHAGIIFLVALGILIIYGAEGAFEDNVAYNGGECGFTISATSLSKSEFKSKLQEYANKHSQWQIFVTNADDYYDYAKAKGVNPELVVLIAYKEGNGYETTPNTNNYWGWGCPNGAKTCAGLYSFMDGAKNVIDSASKYKNLMDWFVIGHYSYIGNYWFNPGSSGLGGCYYAKYAYPDNMPSRVANACAKGNECSGSACVKTTEEDQTAYANYLVYGVMAKGRESIFGLSAEEGVTCSYKSTGIVEDYVVWMINFAADDKHGYSQANRQMNPDVDCSSFVYYGLLKGAGFSVKELGGSWPFTTSSMTGILKDIGFKVYPYNEKELVRGDILWKNGHTEVYVGDGKNVGAHSNKDGRSGDSGGKEVNVQSNYSGWTSYFRYEGNN